MYIQFNRIQSSTLQFNAGEYTTIKTLMEVVVYLQMPLAHANVGLPTNAMAWSPTQAALPYD